MRKKSDNMNIQQNTFVKRKLFKIAMMLFFVGLMIGVNLAYAENNGENIPIPILMIFFIPIAIIGFSLVKK